MENAWRERLTRYRLPVALAAGTGVAAALAMAAANAGQAQENSKRGEEGRKNGQSINAEADFTPFERFTPPANSAPCTGEESEPQSEPFLLPARYK